MVDLVPGFQVCCSPTSPGAKGRNYWFNTIDRASRGLNVCPLRLQDAACSGFDHMYRKGRIYLVFWNKVCWFCRHGIRELLVTTRWCNKSTIKCLVKTPETLLSRLLLRPSPLHFHLKLRGSKMTKVVVCRDGLPYEMVFLFDKGCS